MNRMWEGIVKVCRELAAHADDSKGDSAARRGKDKGQAKGCGKGAGKALAFEAHQRRR